MPCTINDFRLLLAEAGRLYEKHETGRPKPFNVFSVLRSTHDEVNLHSRFLHALLSYRNPHAATRDNLEDFLCAVGIDGLDEDHAIVERERDNVDILIRDPRAKQSVVIENKIWAADQPEQLLRYAEDQLKAGYKKAHLLYLTLDGHEPEEHSKGDLDVRCISYRDEIRPWLERCQKRAFDEPELRESVAQYRDLVSKLTGTDMSKAYLKELGTLLLNGNNLDLVKPLNDALDELKVSLFQQLWKDIEKRLSEIQDFPNKANEQPEDRLFEPDISRQRIERYVMRRKKRGRYIKWHGLYFKITNIAYLGVEVDNSIVYGVKCWKNNKPESEYGQLKEYLTGFGNGSCIPQHEHCWPWICMTPTKKRNPNLWDASRDDLTMLSDSDARTEYVADVVSGITQLWQKLVRNDLVSSPA